MTPSAVVATPAAHSVVSVTVNTTPGASLAAPWRGGIGDFPTSPFGGSADRLYLELERTIGPLSNADVLTR